MRRTRTISKKIRNDSDRSSTPVESHRQIEILIAEGFDETGFKHEAVARVLKAGIERGIWKPGDKIPSEHEIAALFQVAYMTARQAVLSLVQEGLLERVARQGTFVPQPQPKPRAPTSPEPHIYLLLRGAKPSLDPLYFPYIMESFERELEAEGFEYTVFDSRIAAREEAFPKGSLLCCFLISPQEVTLAKMLKERGHRVATVNRSGENDGLPYVSPDNEEGACIAVRHLVELGHTSIGFIRGPGDNLDARERRRGYLRALEEAGLEPGPEAGAGFSEEAGFRAAKQILTRSKRPTALFCASDVSAVGVMTALVEAGLRVPHDVSVVGFGDFPIARFWQPSLTTVRLPLPELGTHAARAMVRLFNGEPIESEALPLSLVPRNSTQVHPDLRVELVDAGS